MVWHFRIADSWLPWDTSSNFHCLPSRVLPWWGLVWQTILFGMVWFNFFQGLEPVPYMMEIALQICYTYPHVYSAQANVLCLDDFQSLSALWFRSSSLTVQTLMHCLWKQQTKLPIWLQDAFKYCNEYNNDVAKIKRDVYLNNKNTYIGSSLPRLQYLLCIFQVSAPSQRTLHRTDHNEVEFVV